MPFRLRYQSHDLELPQGEFVIGRSPDCQLSVDDPMVSRRHAVLRVRGSIVTAEDLGSRNGIVINGKKIEGEKPLGNGDTIKIGAHELSLRWVDDRARRRHATLDASRHVTQTLGDLPIDEIRGAFGGDGPATEKGGGTELSKVRNQLKLLGGVADKALAMGKAEEAERVLQTVLTSILDAARGGEDIDEKTAAQAAKYAAMLAGITTKGDWLDYVFELYTLEVRLLPASVVDELYTVVRKVKSIDITKIRAYVAELHQLVPQMGPGERFLVQRIEGIERLGALK